MGRGKHYRDMNGFAELFGNTAYNLLSMSAVSFLLGPLLLVTYYAINGNLTSDKWQLPIPIVYYFTINYYFFLTVT